MWGEGSDVPSGTLVTASSSDRPSQSLLFRHGFGALSSRSPPCARRRCGRPAPPALGPVGMPIGCRRPGRVVVAGRCSRPGPGICMEWFRIPHPLERKPECIEHCRTHPRTSSASPEAGRRAARHHSDVAFRPDVRRPRLSRLDSEIGIWTVAHAPPRRRAVVPHDTTRTWHSVPMSAAPASQGWILRSESGLLRTAGHTR